MPLNQLFILAFITSLKILFVYCAMKEGMFLSWLRIVLEKGLYLMVSLDGCKYSFWTNISRALRKPLYDCIFCMASIWGMIFTTEYFSFTWEYLQLLFVIAGINYLLGVMISKDEE